MRSSIFGTFFRCLFAGGWNMCDYIGAEIWSESKVILPYFSTYAITHIPSSGKKATKKRAKNTTSHVSKRDLIKLFIILAALYIFSSKFQG
jgi:hypothetical protein